MNITDRILSAIIVASLFALAGCAPSVGDGQSKPLVAVGIPPIGAMVRSIAGDKVDVFVLSDSETDPETFEPSPAQRLRMAKADAYIMAGHLPYESALAASLKNDNPAMLIVDASAGITPIEGTHKHIHHGRKVVHTADPHTWTSVRNASIIARNIAKALKATSPVDSTYFMMRADSVCLQYEKLDSMFAAQLSAVPSRAFLIWHPSLSYFARDYGLHQVALEAEGKEATPGALRRSIDSGESSGAKVFFMQRQYDNRSAEAVASGLGVKTVTINPLDSLWAEQLQYIADELSQP